MFYAMAWQDRLVQFLLRYHVCQNGWQPVANIIQE
jgi:hypothetical protein